jgi:pyruvate kinase
VVVGVKDAMKLLANETLVTVDADRGHIYSGKANVI